jgi:hypothetical protein
MPANQTLQIGQVKQLTDKLTTENTWKNMNRQLRDVSHSGSAGNRRD